MRSFVRTGIKLIAAWTTTFLVLAAILFFTKLADQTSRLWLAAYYAGGLGLLLTGRFAVARFVETRTRAGRFDRRTAIVGGGEAGEALIGALSAQPDSGISIIGVFDDRNDDRSTDTVAGVPKLGNVDELVAYARANPLDLIVFTIPISAEGRILQMLAKLWVLPIDIRLSAHAAKLRLRPRSYSYLGSVPVLDVFDKPIADWDVVVKATFDRVVALLAVIGLSPVMIAAALAVRLTSRGPILFKQKRHGFNNELIEVYKFRSMYVDTCDVTGGRTVTKGDPRVTPVGRILRKTSLDELPQLFNVLKGDLSLVGPRPHALQSKAADTLFDQVVDGYFARHRSSPASPAGLRSTAGAARRTPPRSSSAAWSTTCTTSRTGRCCSTCRSWRPRRSRCSRPRTRIRGNVWGTSPAVIPGPRSGARDPDTPTLQNVAPSRLRIPRSPSAPRNDSDLQRRSGQRADRIDPLVPLTSCRKTQLRCPPSQPRLPEHPRRRAHHTDGIVADLVDGQRTVARAVRPEAERAVHAGEAGAAVSVVSAKRCEPYCRESAADSITAS